MLGKIAIDNQDADEKIDETTGKAEGFSSKLKKGIGTAAKWGTAIVGGAAAAAGGLVKFAQSSAATGDNVDKMSQKIGISRKAYQELDFICSQSGTNVDNLQMGMKSLTSAMDGAKSGTAANIEQFKKLGVSVTNADGSFRGQEEVLWDTLSALQGMEDQTEKSRLATELFGRSGTELMPLLNGASGSIEEMKKKAHDLGLVLSDDTVDSSVKLTDTIDQMKRAASSIITKLGASLMPILQKVCSFIIQSMPTIQSVISQIEPFITEFFSKIMPPLMNLAQQIFPLFMQLLLTIMPPLIEIITAILPVITDLLTMLLPPLISIVRMILPPLLQLIRPIISLLRPIFNLLKPIISAVMQLLKPLIKLINMILPPLISLFTKFIKYILPVIQSRIAGVAKVLGNQFSNIFNTIGSIVKSIKKVLSGIIEFITGVFTGNWKKAWNGIKKIVSGIWQGIWAVIKGIINTIINGINLLWGGIYSAVKGIVDAIGGIAGAIGDLFGEDWSFSMPKEPPLIPQLAKGGVLRKGQVGFLEGDGDEAVVPLEKNTGWISSVAQKIAFSLPKYETRQSDRVNENTVKSIVEKILKNIKIELYLDGDKLVGGTKNRMYKEINKLKFVAARGGSI